jgi:hypothetical protein
MKKASIKNKPMTMAINVMPGDEPNAMGIGPIMTSPAKFAFRADRMNPVKTSAKPVSIKVNPILNISVIDFLF